MPTFINQIFAINLFIPFDLVFAQHLLKVTQHHKQSSVSMVNALLIHTGVEEGVGGGLFSSAHTKVEVIHSIKDRLGKLNRFR